MWTCWHARAGGMLALDCHGRRDPRGGDRGMSVDPCAAFADRCPLVSWLHPLVEGSRHAAENPLTGSFAARIRGAQVLYPVAEGLRRDVGLPTPRYRPYPESLVADLFATSQPTRGAMRA